MTRALHWLLRIALVASVSAGCLLLSDDGKLPPSGTLLSGAQARVGRPLTPMSYAGVARRTTRRSVATGVAVGAAAGVAVGAATAYAPGCYQAVDAYGRIYWRCP
jgi:hypothetical protein